MIPLRILWRATPTWAKVALCCVLVAFALFWAGGWAERQKGAVRDAEAISDTIERVQDAIDADPGCGWADRLRDACD